MNRRRFAFLVGMGLFWISDKLRAESVDQLAAALMRGTEPQPEVEHIRWKQSENNRWQWYERETLVDGKWKLTGVTTPVNKQTGKPYTGRSGYLDESEVPIELRRANRTAKAERPTDSSGTPDGQPDPLRRQREGRPPSKWLRSLRAEEIRIWLKTIEVPEYGVSGMTFWTHLTRDHSFDPEKIKGLTIPEQAKLHAAAHYGY